MRIVCQPAFNITTSAPQQKTTYTESVSVLFMTRFFFWNCLVLQVLPLPHITTSFILYISKKNQTNNYISTLLGSSWVLGFSSEICGSPMRSSWHFKWFMYVCMYVFGARKAVNTVACMSKYNVYLYIYIWKTTFTSGIYLYIYISIYMCVCPSCYRCIYGVASCILCVHTPGIFTIATYVLSCKSPGAFTTSSSDVAGEHIWKKH